MSSEKTEAQKLIDDVNLKKRTFNWLVTDQLCSISKAAKAMLLTDSEVQNFKSILWGR